MNKAKKGWGGDLRTIRAAIKMKLKRWSEGIFFFFFGSMFSSVELFSIPLSLYSKQAFFLIILIGNFLFIMKGF